MPCQNIGVEEVPEKVVQCGPDTQCSPERDPKFIKNCPAYTLTYPSHRVPIKKEGFKLSTTVQKLDVMKQEYTCKIKKMTMSPDEGGESYYVGECIKVGNATKHSKVSDYSEEPC
jgi:hypothetical protein